MEIIRKQVFLLLIVFILLNLTPSSDSRVLTLGKHAPKIADKTPITYADLRPVRDGEHQHPHGSSGVVAGFLDGLNQDSYGAPYGYESPYPGGIYGFPRGIFWFPRGLFGFPRGLLGFPGGIFGFPRGLFGFPGAFGGNPGVYGVNPGGYGGNPGGYGGGPGGYGGGQPGGRPGGGGYPTYEGKTKAKAKGN